MSFLGGDFRYFWIENIGEFSSFPSAWDTSLNTGIGKSALSTLWINSYLNFTASFNSIGFSWEIIGVLFWILPAVVLSFITPILLARYILEDKSKTTILSGIIYSTNTYFLMVLTGGQMGVSLAYSLAPLVLLRFIRILKDPTIKNASISGLVLGMQILFDPRLVYLTLFAFFLYGAFNFSTFIRIIKSSLLVFLLPFLIAIFLHSYWVLPLILTRSSSLPSGFTSVQSFIFFSFADFSHSLSLLHPNWPENIFGKTYFLSPEFLLLPFIAFSSLLFTKKKNLIFLCFLALIGVFLAKGVNQPFGQVNELLFQYFPGLIMFRDPTKFYILIALSYSMLIPFTISELTIFTCSKLKIKNEKSQFKIQSLFFLFSTFSLLFLISSHWGELREKLRPREVPKEYDQLKDFLVSQSEFFRTLWIPEWQRFGYFSNLHPAIGRREIFEGNAKNQIEKLNRENAENFLSKLSVKYVIIPFDSEGEIFLNDRKYDSRQYKETVNSLRKITWFSEVKGFDKMRIFEVMNPKDHFWSPSRKLSIHYKFLSPTEYKVQIQNAKKGDLLVFSENFDKNWVAESSKFKVQSSRFVDMLNSFILPESGSYELTVYYSPQGYVEVGMFTSVATLLGVLSLLIFGKRSKK